MYNIVTFEVAMTKRKNRKYDKEFKINAVRLYLKRGKNFREMGKELGIPFGTLADWVEEYRQEGEKAFPGKGYPKDDNLEITLLKKKLADALEDAEILKKALGIFSLPQK